MFHAWAVWFFDFVQDVKFPLNFDAYDLCSPSLQERLRPARDKFEAEEEAKAEAQLAGKAAGKGKKSPPEAKANDPPKEYERYDFPDGKIHLCVASVA